MKAKVWFLSLSENESEESVARKAVKLADLAGMSDIVKKNGLVGILQHMGERENIGHIKPQVTEALTTRILQMKGKPFLTGSSTLYRGRRSNACDHIMQAYDHGFTPAAIKCPVIMCDGLRGSDYIKITVPNAKYCKTAYIGSALALMDGLIVVTHPTGHPVAGYGASIKNVSMGLASRGGKMSMHHGSYPNFVTEQCTGCGRCAQWCPGNAIIIENKKAHLLKEKCIGCGQCLAICPSNAIDFNWSIQGLEFQERLVDYCVAVKTQIGDSILYLNVIQHFQKGCDCMGNPEQAVCPDLGIAVSRDIVAVDTATADLLIRATGKDIVRDVGDRDYRKMLTYAEEHGLGSRDYELIEP